MKKIIYKKGLVFVTVIFLISSIAMISSVNAQLIVAVGGERSKSDVFDTDKQAIATVQSFGINDENEKYEISLTVDEALELKSRLKEIYETGNSSSDIYENQLNILKEIGVIHSDLTIDSVLNSKHHCSENRNVNDALDPWEICFLGLGWAFPFGSHSVTKYFPGGRIVGLDIILSFIGLFEVIWFPLNQNITEFPDPGLNYLGLCIGFVGFLIDLNFAGLYGPVQIGIGSTVFGPPLLWPGIKS